MTYLVTGAAGFIGARFVELFSLEQGISQYIKKLEERS